MTPLGFSDLELKMNKSGEELKCPIKGCLRWVPIQKKTFRREDRFKCPDHKIFISPSTFEYEALKDALLWKHDLDLLEPIMSEKRECRMTRERSEDALTWNVFRYLEMSDSMGIFFDLLGIRLHGEPSLFYWSYDPETKRCWDPLNKARRDFKERPKGGTEPDLIIKTGSELVIVEAKFTSGNITRPHNASNYRNYTEGGGRWFKNTFTSDYQTVAVDKGKYELMRLWLLGTYIADDMKLDFRLVSLLREKDASGISDEYRGLIKETGMAKYSVVSWEALYRKIRSFGNANANKSAIMRYFEEKTTGYSNGSLKRAFILAP